MLYFDHIEHKVHRFIRLNIFPLSILLSQEQRRSFKLASSVQNILESNFWSNIKVSLIRHNQMSFPWSHHLMNYSMIVNVSIETINLIGNVLVMMLSSDL